MDYAGATGGFDLEARMFNRITNELAERLGLYDGRLHAWDLTYSTATSDDLHWKAHIAWGYFASTS